MILIMYIPFLPGRKGKGKGGKGAQDTQDKKVKFQGKKTKFESEDEEEGEDANTTGDLSLWSKIPKCSYGVLKNCYCYCQSFCVKSLLAVWNSAPPNRIVQAIGNLPAKTVCSIQTILFGDHILHQ